MILVTGGCRSGKSEFAEALVMKGGSEHWLYIATAKITDREMEERVKKHRQRRSERWETLELYGEVSGLLASKQGRSCDGILMDSVTTWVTNLLFDFIGDVDWESFQFEDVDFSKALQWIMKQVRGLVAWSKERPVVFVTDEIGLGVVPETCLGRNFRDILGSVNQYLAGECESVYLVVSGIPVKIKGKDGAGSL